MTGTRVLKSVRTLGLVLLGLWSASQPGFAQQTEKTKPSTEQAFSEQELKLIQDRLDQLTHNHQQLLQAVEAIKAELAAAKIRVTD